MNLWLPTKTRSHKLWARPPPQQGQEWDLCPLPACWIAAPRLRKVRLRLRKTTDKLQRGITE